MSKFVATTLAPATAPLKGSEPSAIRRWAAAAAWPWLGLLRALIRWRLAQQQWLELRQLDHHVLRDLGIDRSELASYNAESAGTAPRTRRRVSRGAGPE